MKNYLFILLVFSTCFLNAQRTNKVFCESGVVINQPFPKSFVETANNDYVAGYKNYTCYGYFFKAGIDFGLLKRKAFSLELPVGFSYKNVNSKTWKAGMSGGCRGDYSAFASFYYNFTSKRNVQSVDFSFGIQPKIDVKRFTFGGNLMVNAFMNCKEKTSTYYENQGFGITTKSTFRNLGTYVAFSSGFESLYSVKRFAFGPKCDFFFTRSGGYRWSLSDGAGSGKLVWINPGIKMSYSLSNKAK